VHSKKIGTFFTAGLTHFFLVLFINVEGPLYRANRGSLQYFCIYCRAKSVDLPYKRIFGGIAQLVERAADFVISGSSVRIRLRALSILDFRLAIFDLRGGFAHPQAHAHDAKDAVACFQVTGRTEVARPGKIDIDYFLDRGGTIAHDENAIGKLHGFFNVVGDKENCLSFRFARCAPDRHTLFRSQ
jgi:hypothetical protein